MQTETPLEESSTAGPRSSHARGVLKLARKPIVLIGFMASGKSTIGPIVAELLQVPFVDTDVVIEEECRMTILEIFGTKGEQWFRQKERDVLSRSLSSKSSVIAVGGGAFVDPALRRTIRSTSLTVWLDVPFEIVRARLSRSCNRPLVTGASAEELSTLWEQRRPAYASADLHIQISDHDPATAAAMIVDHLKL